MIYRTEIRIWSRAGHTPLTNRAKRDSSYCDLLFETVVFCQSPDAARAETRALIKATPHGDIGHFNMPDHPNQNTRNRFTH